MGSRRPTRRSVLRGTVLAGTAAAAGALAGCADDAQPPSAADTASTRTDRPRPTTDGPVPDAPITPGDGGGPGNRGLAPASRVPVAGAVIFAAEAVVVTQPTAGTFKAFDTTCTHQGCPVTEVKGDVIECPCHFSRYGLDGAVVRGPATEPLAPVPVRVQGGRWSSDDARKGSIRDDAGARSPRQDCADRPALPSRGTIMAEPTRPLDRRTVLRGAALAGGGLTSAALLAGCGEDESGGSGSASPEPASTPVSVPTADVEVGGGLIVDETYVVTQPAKGEFKAFTAVCTHQGCVVASVADNTIQCDCHGSQYDAATGEVTQGPATEGLAEETVQVKGNQLTVG